MAPTPLPETIPQPRETFRDEHQVMLTTVRAALGQVSPNAFQDQLERLRREGVDVGDSLPFPPRLL